MIPSLLVLAWVFASGYGVTTWMAPRLRGEERIVIGAPVGVVCWCVGSFTMFEVVGMRTATVLLGLVPQTVVGAFGLVRHRERLRMELRSCGRRLALPTRRGRSLRPLALFSLAAAAVSTRTLALAYQRTADGLSAGSLSTWADWAAHLAYAGSFAYGDNRGLDLPVATGTHFRYHFLGDFFGSLFTTTGATLPQSMALSSWALAIVLPPLLWCAVMRLHRSRTTAALTNLLFLLSGGLGAYYFLVDLHASGRHILGTLPRTYARIPEQHLWVDNTISASLYAQRSTLIGLTVGFAVLVLVLAARPTWSRRTFATAGVLLGTMGIGHAHTMLTGLALACMALLADRRLAWLWFIVPVVVVGAPLAWSITPETNSMRWMVGWMAPASGQPWIWFWLRNVGLLLPLFAGLSLLGGAPARLRRLTAPLWLWFVVPNVVAFHPAEWNNTKYFLFWQLAGCLLVASWLSSGLHAMARRSSGQRWLVGAGTATCVVLMVSAGGLDMVRAMQRSTAIPWVNDDDLAAAAWVRANTPPDDVIVYGVNNTSAVAALGGRRAVSGYAGWTFDLGLDDWVQRWQDSREILRGGPDTAAAVARYGVDLVVIGPAERRDAEASDAYWNEHAALAFRSGDVSVYQLATAQP